MVLSKLRGRIKEKYNTETAFAKELGVSRTQMSFLTSGKADWNSDLILKAVVLLDIPLTDIALYFLPISLECESTKDEQSATEGEKNE